MYSNVQIMTVLRQECYIMYIFIFFRSLEHDLKISKKKEMKAR